MFDGGKYLARYTFESLNELFTASQQLQEWLTDCAKVSVTAYTGGKRRVYYPFPLNLLKGETLFLRSHLSVIKLKYVDRIGSPADCAMVDILVLIQTRGF